MSLSGLSGGGVLVLKYLVGVPFGQIKSPVKSRALHTIAFGSIKGALALTQQEARLQRDRCFRLERKSGMLCK